MVTPILEFNDSTSSTPAADTQIYFQWQNPHLLKTIYPARKSKFLEFLLVYDEIEVVKIYKSKTIDEIKREYDELPDSLPNITNQELLKEADTENKIALGQDYIDQYNRLMGTRLDTSQELNQRDAYQATRAVMLNQMMQHFEHYKDLDHKALLTQVVERFHKSPEIFPEWLIYMVIHFSGMRYQSAHGCYRDPLDLLRVLGVDTKGLSDGKALQKLKEYKQEQDKANRSIPDWAWHDIVKFTPLRNETEEDDWEAKRNKDLSTDEGQRWDQILKSWEPANKLRFNNLTLWRFKHADHLGLIVTSVVCNEVGEHIQHLRGLSTSAGLAMKPDWYNKQKTKGSFFKHQDLEDDFQPGAAIFWLEWYGSNPGAHEVVTPLTGIDLTGRLCAGKLKTGAPKYLEEWTCWQNNNRFFRTINVKPIQDDKELIKILKKESDLNQKQIKKLTNQLKKASKLAKGEKTALEREIKTLTSKIEQSDQKITKTNQKSGKKIEYLRWVHEAIVVSVENMINGRKVITFETYGGTMGINLRPNQNLQGSDQDVFIGYSPAKELPETKDQRLVEMIRWDKILREPDYPMRVRHQDALDKIISIPKDETALEERLMVIQPGGIKLKKVTLKRGTQLFAVRQDKEGITTFRVTRCDSLPEVVGAILNNDDVTTVSTCFWIEIKEATKCKQIVGWNKKKHPMFKRALEKLTLVPGKPFLVSATHQFNPKTDQGGLIQGDGKSLWYLIVQHPDLPEAAGLYVGAGKTIQLSPPEAWELIQSKIQGGIKPGSDQESGGTNEEVIAASEGMIMVINKSGVEITDNLLLPRGSLLSGKSLKKGGAHSYLITRSDDFPLALGLRIKATEVTPVETCLVVKLAKPTRGSAIVGFNKKGKPLLEGMAPKVSLAVDVPFLVSAAHQINPTDKNGLVQGDGKRSWYLVLVYPGQPEATGLYVEANKLSLLSGPLAWEEAKNQIKTDQGADSIPGSDETQDDKPE